MKLSHIEDKVEDLEYNDGAMILSVILGFISAIVAIVFMVKGVNLPDSGFFFLTGLFLCLFNLGIGVFGMAFLNIVLVSIIVHIPILLCYNKTTYKETFSERLLDVATERLVVLTSLCISVIGFWVYQGVFFHHVEQITTANTWSMIGLGVLLVPLATYIAVLFVIGIGMVIENTVLKGFWHMRNTTHKEQMDRWSEQIKVALFSKQHVTYLLFIALPLIAISEGIQLYIGTFTAYEMMLYVLRYTIFHLIGAYLLLVMTTWIIQHRPKNEKIQQETVTEPTTPVQFDSFDFTLDDKTATLVEHIENELTFFHGLDAHLDTETLHVLKRIHEKDIQHLCQAYLALDKDEKETQHDVFVEKLQHIHTYIKDVRCNVEEGIALKNKSRFIQVVEVLDQRF